MPPRTPSSLSRSQGGLKLGDALAGAQPLSLSERLSDILRAAKDPDWAVRLEACADMKGVLRSSLSPTPRDIGRIAAFLVDTFSEPHNKVQFASLPAVTCNAVPAWLLAAQCLAVPGCAA